MDSRTPFATVLLSQPTLRRMIKLACWPSSTSASPSATT
jgi:hypothetical protein